MKIGILILIFLAAVLVSSLVMNKGTDDQTISLGEPTLPMVSVIVDDNEVNALPGYTTEMNITAMRDTITPVAATRTLQLNLYGYGEQIQKISYEAYSLDGKDCYLKENVEEWNGEIRIRNHCK